MTNKDGDFDTKSLTQTFMLSNISSEAIRLLADLLSVAAQQDGKDELVYDSLINKESFEHFVHYVAKEWLGDRHYEQSISIIRDQLREGVYYDDRPLFDEKPNGFTQ